MIHAYSELYLAKAQTTLGGMLDYAVRDLGFDITRFFDMFISTGTAERFGQGDCSIIAGRSGAELVFDVLLLSNKDLPNVQPSYADGRSEEYWTGWALAYYQWDAAIPFEEINKFVPIENVRALYDPYHEMDIRQFVDEMNRLVSFPMAKAGGGPLQID